MCPDPTTLVQLVAAGYSDTAIGDHFRVTDRTIRRWRAALEIRSEWTPQTIGHTPSVCPCDDCRQARNLDAARYRHARQTASQHAPRHCLPWTAEEDAALMRLGVTQASARLGRTYFACVSRRRILTQPKETTTTH